MLGRRGNVLLVRAGRGPRAMRRAGRGPRRGVATVELALVLPVLLLLLAIAADYARVYQRLQVLSVCARNGALYACDVQIAQDSPYDDVASAALAAAGGLREQMTIDCARTSDASGVETVAVTARCPFETVLVVPGVPRRLDLARTVRARLPRAALEEAP